MSEESVRRQGEPHEDDNLVSRIEIEFAIPTFLPQGFMQDLDSLLSAAVRLKRNQPYGGVHWVSGHGSKPLWSQVDALFLGKTPADDASQAGEPRWDDSVYHIETSARPLNPGEKVRETRPGTAHTSHVEGCGTDVGGEAVSSQRAPAAVRSSS